MLNPISQAANESNADGNTSSVSTMLKWISSGEMLSRSKSASFQPVKQGLKAWRRTTNDSDDSDSDIEVGHLGKMERRLPKPTSCMELNSKFRLPQIDDSPTNSSDNLQFPEESESFLPPVKSINRGCPKTKRIPKATTVCFSDLFSAIGESNSSDSEGSGQTTPIAKRPLRPPRCHSSQNLKTPNYQVIRPLDLQSPTEDLDVQERLVKKLQIRCNYR